MTQAKNTICLWYDGEAEEAANFYAATFPDSKVTAVHKAPGDFLSGKKGDVLTVDFTVCGVPCIGLNGGPIFKHRKWGLRCFLGLAQTQCGQACLTGRRPPKISGGGYASDTLSPAKAGFDSWGRPATVRQA